MDTKVFFERGDEFKNNPLHFAVHRISNLGTWTKVVNAKTRLEKGNVDGCKEALDEIDKELVGMIEFLRQFAKEYDEFKEAGNVIIPKRMKYAIEIVALKDATKQAIIVSDEEPEANDSVFHVSGKFMAKCVKVKGGYLYHKTDEGAEGNNYPYYYKKVIGKAPQSIIDGLATGTHKEGDEIGVKLVKKDKQVRYTNGEYAREYQEVEVPEVIGGIVTCEK